MANLLYFADPMCSWCYGYSTVISQLAKTHAVQTIMGGLRGIETPPMTLATREKIQAHWKHVEDATAKAGAPVTFEFQHGIPEGFVYNTEPACRAVVLVQQWKPESVLPFMAAVQKEFYGKGKDVTQATRLAAIAEDVGFNAAEFLKRFDAKETATATQEQFITTQQFGVTGFPALMIEKDGEWHPISMGYTPLDVAEQKIAALSS
jgi:putative protein-disulfide isomerase